MVSVGLVSWVPVFSRGLKGVLGIADSTVAKFMDMKAVGADRFYPIAGWLIGGKTIYFYTDPGTERYIVEQYNTVDLGP